MSDTKRIFPFVQFEIARTLGPPRGRYLVRPASGDGSPAAAPADAEAVKEFTPEEEPRSSAARASVEADATLLGTADVLVIRHRGAPEPKAGLFRPRRAQPARDGAEPRPLTVTECTVVLATWTLDKRRDAAGMMRAIKSSSEEQEHVIAEGLEVLNRAISAHRVSSADPYAIDISRVEPRAVRIGYGAAERVVAGRWDDAVSVPAPRLESLSREARLQPLEGMAAVLSGQSRVLESEEMLLRVMIDLDQGRTRAAAVGLVAVVDLLDGELAGEVLRGEVMEQLETVRELDDERSELARRALSGPLGDEQRLALKQHVETVGALVDGWRYRRARV